MDRLVWLTVGGLVVGSGIAVAVWRPPKAAPCDVQLERVTIRRAAPPVPSVMQRSGVRGTVVDLAGRPLRAGSVRVDHGGKWPIAVSTSPSGSFVLDLAPGDYVVEADDLPHRALGYTITVKPGELTELRLVSADGQVRLRSKL